MKKIIVIFFSLWSCILFAQEVQLSVYVPDGSINQLKISHLNGFYQEYGVDKKKATIEFSVNESDIYFISTNLSDTIYFPILIQPMDRISFELSQDSLIRLKSVKGSKEIEYIVSFMNEFYKTKKDLQRFENSYINSSPSLKNILYMQYADFYERLNNRLGHILLKHNESIANSVLIRSVDLTHNPVLYQQLTSILIDQYADNLYVKDLKKDTLVCSRVIRYKNIVSQNFHRKLSSLSQYHGHYILLHFWASWAKVSRKENASILDIYHQYHDSKLLEIFSVGVEADESAWKEAIDEDGLNWENVSDLQAWQSEIVKDYNVKKLPTYFVIDPDGNIVFSGISIKEVENFLNLEFKDYSPEKK